VLIILLLKVVGLFLIVAGGYAAIQTGYWIIYMLSEMKSGELFMSILILIFKLCWIVSSEVCANLCIAQCHAYSSGLLMINNTK
jgi:hypothetical protein